MPSRVVRSDFLTSVSMSRVSEGAELLFLKLILACDDYGRFHGDPEILRGHLYALRTVPRTKIEARLAELERDGCLLRYRVGDRDYLQLTGWETHRGKSRRGQSSKFPEPETQYMASAEIRGSCGDPPGSRESGVESRESRDSTRGNRGACVFPDPFPAESLAALQTWASEKGFTSAQVRAGIETVRDWALSGGHQKRDWVATIRNGMRQGWAIESAPKDPRPAGQAYAAESHPREVQRREARAQAQQLVDAEAMTGARAFYQARYRELIASGKEPGVAAVAAKAECDERYPRLARPSAVVRRVEMRMGVSS